MLQHIQRGKYFVLHEQCQSGKTSFLLELCDYLNCVGTEYAALYINVEKAQNAWNNKEEGITATFNGIDLRCLLTFGTSFNVTKQTNGLSPLARLETALTIITEETTRKEICFIHR